MEDGWGQRLHYDEEDSLVTNTGKERKILVMEMKGYCGDWNAERMQMIKTKVMQTEYCNIPLCNCGDDPPDPSTPN